MSNKSIYDQMIPAEKEVALFLRDLGIYWNYEKPLYLYDDKNRPRVWTPDFYLVSFGIYVEVCGSKDFDYEYRRKIYEMNGCRVIFLHLYKESKKWVSHLIHFLKLFVRYQNYQLLELINMGVVIN